MDLVVWKGVRGLVSCDPKCLYVLAYCKLAKIPDLSISEVSSWQSLITNTYPKLTVNTNDGLPLSFRKASDIIEYLRERGNGIDSWLTSSESAEACVLEAYVLKSLAPAVEYLLWGDESSAKTINYIYGNNFVKSIIFSNTVYPYVRYRRISELAQTTKLKLMTESDFRGSLIQAAKDCLSNLSSRLTSQSYICGNQVCYIDALVLSYLLFFKQMPTFDRTLANFISQCPKLDTFAKNMSISLFEIDISQNINLPPNQALTMSTSQISEFPHAIRNSIIASVVAIGAIGLYMISTGMLTLEFSDDEVEARKTVKKQPRRIL